MRAEDLAALARGLCCPRSVDTPLSVHQPVIINQLQPDAWLGSPNLSENARGVFSCAARSHPACPSIPSWIRIHPRRRGSRAYRRSTCRPRGHHSQKAIRSGAGSQAGKESRDASHLFLAVQKSGGELLVFDLHRVSNHARYAPPKTPRFASCGAGSDAKQPGALLFLVPLRSRLCVGWHPPLGLKLVHSASMGASQHLDTFDMQVAHPHMVDSKSDMKRPCACHMS